MIERTKGTEELDGQTKQKTKQTERCSWRVLYGDRRSMRLNASQ